MEYWKGVGLEECEIGRVYDWNSVRLAVCRIGRVKDWKDANLCFAVNNSSEGCRIGRV